MQFNIHTHTKRCHHAYGEDEDYIKAAIQTNMHTLGFSDHIPFKHLEGSTIRMAYSQKDEYIHSIQVLAKKYANKINIYVGFESEFIEGEMDFYQELQNEVDYLILGPHFYKDYQNPSSRINNLEDMKLYVDMLEKAMQSGLFTYIAHPDIFLCNTTTITEPIKELIHTIAKNAVKYNCILEWNIEGYRDHLRGRIWPNGTTIGYPNDEFWQIIREYPIPIILGSDAHDPININDEATLKAIEITKAMNLNIIHSLPMKKRLK